MNATEYYEKALEYAMHDHKKMIKYLKLATKIGNAKAMFNLGCYDTGNCVKKNKEVAVVLYQKAAE